MMKKLTWILGWGVGFVVLFAMAFLQTLNPTSHLRYPFYTMVWWKEHMQKQQEFALAEVTPFVWDKVCLADYGYYTLDERKKLEEMVGVPGFDSLRLGLEWEKPGGYLLFIRGAKVIPIEWEDFNEFGWSASVNLKCWDASLRVKEVKPGRFAAK